jgi:hypothetical protein
MIKNMMKMLFCMAMAGFVFGTYATHAADLTQPPKISPPQEKTIPIRSLPISSVTLNYDNNFKSTFEGVIIEATFAAVNTVPSDKTIGLGTNGYIHFYVSPASSNPMPDGRYYVVVNLTNTKAGTFSFYYPQVIWSAFAPPGKIISTCATPLVDGKSIGGCGVDIPLNSMKQIDIDIKHTSAAWITGITIQRYR